MPKEENPEEEFSITELSSEFSVTPRTLRFYESKELLFPRRDGQRRLFSRSDRARLRLILQGKRFGFALEDIRQLLNLYDLGDRQHTQLKATYDKGQERLTSMIEQRQELDLAIADLHQQLQTFKSMIDARSEPPACSSE